MMFRHFSHNQQKVLRTQQSYMHSIATLLNNLHLAIPVNQSVGGSLNSVSSDAHVAAFRKH